VPLSAWEGEEMSDDLGEIKRYLKIYADHCTSQLRILVESQARLIRKLDEILARSPRTTSPPRGD
jgi:hypothetical protein